MTSGGTSLVDGVVGEERAADPGGRGRPATAVAVGAAAAVVVVIRLLAGGGAATFDRVWAEDGAVFLSDAASRPVSSLGWTYAGYLHVVPRLLASATWWLVPTPWAGAALLFLSAAVVGLCAGVSYGVTAAHVAWPSAAVVALLPAGLPWSGTESLGNVANLQFFMLAALCGAQVLGAPARSGAAWWAQALAAAVVAASTPLAAATLAAAVTARGVRGALRDPLAWGVGAGLAAQMLAMAFGIVSPFVNPARAKVALGTPQFAEVVTARGVPMWAVWVCLAVLIAAALPVARALLAIGQRGRAALALLVSAGLLFVVPILVSGYPHPRYWIAPCALIAAAAFVLLGRRRPVAATMLAAVLVLGTAAGFPADSARADGPAWSAELEQHDTACAQGRPLTEVAVSPRGWGASDLPCG